VLGLVLALSTFGIAAAAKALKRVQPEVADGRSVALPADDLRDVEDRPQQLADLPDEVLVEGGDAIADQPLSVPETSPNRDAVPTPEHEQPQVPLDPLAELVQQPEADGLLIRALVLPDQVTLELQVSAGFERLSAAEQQRRAVQWQQWSTDLGYDHLELRDSRAGLLARDALVGSGMIVLSESSRP
jgi:hypothetical protein